MKIISLEQRRQVQCLTLMYRLSKNNRYIKEPNIATRANTKTKFKLMSKCNSKYLNSRLYRGATLWDELDKTVQDLQNVKGFTKELLKSYQVYVDMLN